MLTCLRLFTFFNCSLEGEQSLLNNLGCIQGVDATGVDDIGALINRKLLHQRNE